MSKIGTNVKLVPKTLKTPLPRKSFRPNIFSENGIGNWKMLMRDVIPEVISAAATAYCWSSVSWKSIEYLNMTRGGVMSPPIIAKAC